MRHHLTALVIAVSLALTVPATALAVEAAPPVEQAWVQASNGHAQVLLQAQAPFQPEFVSFFGIPGFDDRTADLGPKVGERYRAAVAKAKAELEARLAVEKDANVRQDLAIMIRAAQEQVDGSLLDEKYLLSWVDAPGLVFQGMNGLLSEQNPPERRAKALLRLQRYVGLAPGATSVFTQAKERFLERTGDAALLGPVKLEVEQALGNGATFVAGIRQLFATYKIEGAEPALAALDQQVTDYVAWARKDVLARSRDDARLPPELYARRLRDVGIDIDPRLLIQRAQLEFMETRAAMQALAPLVAKAKGIEATDYREVIRALKKSQFSREQIEPFYREVMTRLDQKIAEHRVVDLPRRPMQMRLGSEAESAAQPAPHFLPAPLVGNTGQQGAFVLPLGNPGKDGEAGESYDDFNFDAVAWTLSAHEGRPGHELQFTAMVERGVSLARTLFAFNSVNIEGWALYAEAEMVPYEPIEGQLFALQFRLLRAARAMLDPMLNLGMIDRDRAGKVLLDEVVLSPAMTRQELDRYTFRAPGQAGAYFYGYARILELRAETELALGAQFDRMAFNNFLLDQGLLPPELLAKAVREQFVPTIKARNKPAK